jgi:hypothetical protein
VGFPALKFFNNFPGNLKKGYLLIAGGFNQSTKEASSKVELF